MPFVAVGCVPWVVSIAAEEEEEEEEEEVEEDGCTLPDDVEADVIVGICEAVVSTRAYLVAADS
jgi:hypothetical protein